MATSKLHGFRMGDELAFRELFDEFSDMIFRFFMVKTSGNRDQSEDLVQETFIKIWKGRKLYDPDRPFRSWAFSIAYNVFIDHLRSRKETLPLEDYELKSKEDIQGKVHDKLLVEKVLKELYKYPTETRDIMLMSYVGGLTSEEISEVLNKTPSAIRMIRKRTIAKLNESLGGEVE